MTPINPSLPCNFQLMRTEDVETTSSNIYERHWFFCQKHLELKIMISKRGRMAEHISWDEEEQPK